MSTYLQCLQIQSVSVRTSKVANEWGEEAEESVISSGEANDDDPELMPCGRPNNSELFPHTDKSHR